MRYRALGLLAALATGWMISLVSLDAQQQQQRERQTQYDLIADINSACTEITNVRKKEHLTALPAKVIEPERTPEGWPDLQGTWTSNAYRASGLHSIEVGLDPAGFVIQCQDPESNMGNLLINPMRGMIPYQPWAQEKRMEILKAMYAPQRRMDLEPDVLCWPRGVPRVSLTGGYRFRYLPPYVVIFTGGPGSGTRIIPMDGRPHLPEDVSLYKGDSRGRWEGNTLVVETRNNRDGMVFDKHGTFHSGAMRVIERWTLVDQDRLYYEATVEDPAVFTQPWRLAMTLDRAKADQELSGEGACHEGERTGDRMVRAGHSCQAGGDLGLSHSRGSQDW